MSDVYPAFAGEVDLTLEPLSNDRFDGVDVIFLAIPSGEAMNVVPQLLDSADRIIDLGGDFRLKSPQMYEQFYHHAHSSPELLSRATYGLPELNHRAIAAARLVANPGCYPTSVILALLPALKHGTISTSGIVVNSLSGISGAGRASSVDLSFAEINENIRAYKIGRHQHIPEIQTVLEEAAAKPVSFSFVPHLVPITRGIYTTIHADLTATLTETELMDMYETYYAEAPFVRIKRQTPQIRDVARTNYCDIGLAIEPRTNQLIVISVIDNLVKGAAGQAVQNMNIMFGLEETKGLK